jgi:hypothetical protein
MFQSALKISNIAEAVIFLSLLSMQLLMPHRLYVIGRDNLEIRKRVYLSCLGVSLYCQSVDEAWHDPTTLSDSYHSSALPPDLVCRGALVELRKPFHTRGVINNFQRVV